MLEITKREAQALATIASRLDRKRISRVIRPDDILDTIMHLGMVQLDTISVVSRSHETVLWSRLGNFDLDHLTALFLERRALTEYLTHAAAITPTAYVPLMRPTMRRQAQRHQEYWQQPDKADIARRILERIELEGSLGSRHFEPPKDRKKLEQWESWYGSKPEREVLFSLWSEGQLMVSLRDRGFGRWYDLPHRVANGQLELPPLEHGEYQCSVLLHAMRALGVATAPWLTDYWRTGGYAWVANADVRAVMPQLADDQFVFPVRIKGIEESAWLDATMLPVLEQLRAGTGWPTKTTFLSPFDNLIWNRGRMKQLWDVDYTIEIYTPAAKRQYGYYTMPILHRGRLVGLIDPSLNRKEGHLTVRSIHLLAGAKPTPALANAIAKTLDEFSAFLGATDWSVLESSPPELVREIYRQ